MFAFVGNNHLCDDGGLVDNGMLGKNDGRKFVPLIEIAKGGADFPTGALAQGPDLTDGVEGKRFGLSHKNRIPIILRAIL